MYIWRFFGINDIIMKTFIDKRIQLTNSYHKFKGGISLNSVELIKTISNIVKEAVICVDFY